MKAHFVVHLLNNFRINYVMEDYLTFEIDDLRQYEIKM